MSNLFIPAERSSGETRVAASPESVKRFVKLGFSVAVEPAAGSPAGYLDADYLAVGATLATDPAAAQHAADLVVRVQPPAPGTPDAAFAPGTTLVSFLWPLNNRPLTKALADARVSAFAMERVPRITRAQVMDALSSQANLAGYKAVILGAHYARRIFPLLMTAAGTIKPARVVILGAGVAGLQAIATAKRLGAIVEVSDVRLAVKEQVHSLGARFIEVEGAEDLTGDGGYAREASPEYLARQQAAVAKRIAEADVVITTANVPGKKAPTLITEDLVRAMKPGAVIVDMAVESGGNCALTAPNEVIERHGITIVGLANLPALLPANASDVYARNILAVVEYLYPKGVKTLNLDDEIARSAFVTHDGAIRHDDVRAALA